MFTIACRFDRRFTFEPRRTALLMIDFQRDFLDPDGYCAATGGEVGAMRTILPRVAAVLDAARRRELHVIHTREGYLPDGSDMNAMKRQRDVAGRPGPLGRFLIRGEPGQAILPELAPLAGEPAFDKPGYSAFYRSPLQELLRERGVTHLVLAGVTTQCCVHSTLRSAVDRGYWCLTLADCCAALKREWHEAALSLIASENHLFGWLADAADLLNAIEARAAQ